MLRGWLLLYLDKIKMGERKTDDEPVEFVPEKVSDSVRKKDNKHTKSRVKHNE